MFKLTYAKSSEQLIKFTDERILPHKFYLVKHAVAGPDDYVYLMYKGDNGDYICFHHDKIRTAILMDMFVVIREVDVELIVK